MRKALACTFGLAILALAAFGTTARAQDTMRVRGTIERLDGTAYFIKTRDGAELKVTMIDQPVLVAIVKASLADIKPGLFVGSTGMPMPDGSQKAIEVHIFPEAMRGAGEGHYAWDLQPNSTMTNANVEASVTGVDGQTLMLKYKTGEKKILVTQDTVIVTYIPATRPIFSPAQKSSSARPRNYLTAACRQRESIMAAMA